MIRAGDTWRSRDGRGFRVRILVRSAGWVQVERVSGYSCAHPRIGDIPEHGLLDLFEPERWQAARRLLRAVTR